MSKKMTPCERLGYKVGDKFKASKSGAWFNVGEEVELGRDDGSNYPYFFNARMPKDSDGGWPRHIESVEKISNAKLKPAKQSLADAINQNGGWAEGGDWHKSGELPPVGEVCEWLECKQTGWQEVIVAGYYMNAAWIVPKGKEPITVFNPTGFRALRTERDKAIDEMMEHCDYLGSRDFAGKLFDAGYRKEVK